MGYKLNRLNGLNGLNIFALGGCRIIDNIVIYRLTADGWQIVGSSDYPPDALEGADISD
jgi:hypothetical protein